MTALYWRRCTSAVVPTDDGWLSAGEAAVVARLRFPKRRGEWRLGRWTAKEALRAHPQLNLREVPRQELEIRAAGSGAPEALLRGSALPCRISLSHSGDTGVCVVVNPEVAVGCDVELVEERSEAFLVDYFTPAELAWAREAPKEDRGERATLLWSAKESALKALEEGLRLDTREVEATIGEGRPGSWFPLRVVYPAGSRIFEGWWRRLGAMVLTVVSDAPGATPEELG